MSITTEQVRTLRTEAGANGDQAQVAICNSALDGDEAAWKECERVIQDARDNER